MRSAVVDIGSNSIKLLVADGEKASPIFETISETRLSPNRQCAQEIIAEDAFTTGIRAVCELTEKARTFSPDRFAIVGTYLLRVAENAECFSKSVFDATGTPLQILSGIEEAELVAEGVSTDPAAGTPCAIFDLGGGSLEFIAKTNSSTSVFAESWPLGGVKMMRKFLSAPAKKIPREEIASLREFVRKTVEPILSREIPLGAQAILCGGSAGICAQLLCGNQENPTKFLTKNLNPLLENICEKTQCERIRCGVPEKRADIFPAACATLAEICQIGRFSEFIYTRCNLRYGLCSRLNKATGN